MKYFFEQLKFTSSFQPDIKDIKKMTFKQNTKKFDFIQCN